MKYQRYEIKNGTVYKRGEMPRDPYTGEVLCWVIDVGINEPFEGPDFSKWHDLNVSPRFKDAKKVLHTYMNAGGHVRHRLYDYETSTQLYGDLPMTTDVSEWTMPFGKHKGLQLSEIPEDYRRWAAENIGSTKIKELMKNSLLAE